LERQPVDLIVAALDTSPQGSAALVSALRGRPDGKKIPILAAADTEAHVRAFDFRAAGFQDCQPKFDAVAVIESIAGLISIKAFAQSEPVSVGEIR
jgi:hypothetical protein